MTRLRLYRDAALWWLSGEKAGMQARTEQDPWAGGVSPEGPLSCQPLQVSSEVKSEMLPFPVGYGSLVSSPYVTL